MEFVWIFIAGLVFYIAGYIVRAVTTPNPKPIGTLQIDHSDPDMPYLFLLDYDLDYIATKKQATFEVKVEDLISHK